MESQDKTPSYGAVGQARLIMVRRLMELRENNSVTDEVLKLFPCELLLPATLNVQSFIYCDYLHYFALLTSVDLYPFRGKIIRFYVLRRKFHPKTHKPGVC